MKQIIAIALAVGLTATASLAHSKLTSSDPADGSVISNAPMQVTLSFNKPIRLATVVMIAPDGEKIALELKDAGGFATHYVMDNATQTSGRYQMDWRGFSEDGHILKGVISYEVK